MKSNDERPSSRDAFTPFEEELVNAMNDFANSEDAPDFTPAAVMHGSRRRSRPMITAGVAALFIVVGGGTALAVTAGHPGGSTLRDRPVSSTSHCPSSPVPVPLHPGTSSPTPIPRAPVTVAPTPSPLGGHGSPTPAPLRPTSDCGPSATSSPTPVPRHAETTMAPVPAGSPVPVPAHGIAAPVPLAPATAAPVRASERPSGGTAAPSAISSPTPASRSGAVAPSPSPTKR